MTDKFRDSRVSLIAAGIAAAVAGYLLALFALPVLFPGIAARQLDSSSQDVARFLQQARIASIERNAPVACRIDKHGGRMVLSLDWNMNGSRVHPAGLTLALPYGVVVAQRGETQPSGVIAVFNPRGGLTVASSFPARGKPLLLYVSRPGRQNLELRAVGMTRTGEFQAFGPQDGVNQTSPAFVADSGSNGAPRQVTASLNVR